MEKKATQINDVTRNQAAVIRHHIVKKQHSDSEEEGTKQKLIEPIEMSNIRILL